MWLLTWFFLSYLCHIYFILVFIDVFVFSFFALELIEEVVAKLTVMRFGLNGKHDTEFMFPDNSDRYITPDANLCKALFRIVKACFFIFSYRMNIYSVVDLTSCRAVGDTQSNI